MKMFEENVSVLIRVLSLLELSTIKLSGDLNYDIRL